ncbi:LCCL domain-containing protein [Terricaulis sp.]|uniref:LCCL domain-containing protein n=1 Tax=Terricaulis sp. TaxID=2768686 RepID=UPI003783510E
MQKLAAGLAALGIALIAGSFAHEATAQAQEGAEGERAAQTALAETHWAGRVRWSGRARDDEDWTLYFRSDGVLIYSAGRVSHEDGAWRQRGALVSFDAGDASAVGALRDGVLEGAAYTQEGARATWRFRREVGQIYACPHNLVAMRGAQAALECICPENVATATAWGDASAYTDDSDICTAAVHAGAISATRGGRVTVWPREGRAAYPASTANGVTTFSYGSWPGSYVIAQSKTSGLPDPVQRR